VGWVVVLAVRAAGWGGGVAPNGPSGASPPDFAGGSFSPAAPAKKSGDGLTPILSPDHPLGVRKGSALGLRPSPEG
jgi:hypothetical protein